MGFGKGTALVVPPGADFDTAFAVPTEKPLKRLEPWRPEQMTLGRVRL
jgi:hypothetical protein